MWQCTECGFQVDPPQQEHVASSYREPADPLPGDRRPACPCTNCGEEMWANLREGGVVEALIEKDETRFLSRVTGRNRILKGVSLLICAVVVALTVQGDGSPILHFTAAMALGIFLRSSFGEIAAGPDSRFPISWRFTPRPRGRRRAKTRGRAQRGKTTALLAPLSGRPCLAYELGVRHDSDSQDRERSWTLLEQRNCEFTVEGVPVEAPYLKLDRAAFFGELSRDAQVELRKRGVDPTRPGYNYYETIVEDDARVTLHRYRHATVLCPDESSQPSR